METTGGNTKFNYADVKSAAGTLRAIDNKIRQQILKLLEENKRVIVTDIYAKLHLGQSVTSSHLGILRRANIVITERDRRVIYYSLNHTHIAVVSDFINKMINK